MESKKIIECVPNFCEGQNKKTIEEIRNAIESQAGIEFKCVDTGYYANRSVYTFLGPISSMFEAAYKSIEVASLLIDMRKHHGFHPRFGAVDVFPFVAIRHVSQAELIPMVEEFAEKVAIDFKIPTYLYEKSAKRAQTKNLANIRKGEYEGLALKMNSNDWIPDFYPKFNEKTGGMAMGVRDILVAFNVNLDTKDVAIAKKIAADIRFSGKLINGVRFSGLCEGVKALGWYIQDFDKVQVSMNIVDIVKTPVHIAFETCRMLAERYGVKVTGSELIGCIPKHCLVATGEYLMNSEKSQNDFSTEQIIQKGIDFLNLNEVKAFDKEKNIIELDRFNS